MGTAEAGFLDWFSCGCLRVAGTRNPGVVQAVAYLVIAGSIGWGWFRTGRWWQTLQGGRMSDSLTPKAELELIRLALADLTVRVNRVIEAVEDYEFEVVERPNIPVAEPTPPVATEAAAASSAAAVQVGAGGYSHAEREAAARETGEFFVRALNGEPRGSSGRGRIRLQNRIYVVIRSFAGEVFTKPVVALYQYTQVKKLVCHPRAESFGDSIFAGFPSKWEAQLAVATAGYDWP